MDQMIIKALLSFASSLAMVAQGADDGSALRAKAAESCAYALSRPGPLDPREPAPAPEHHPVTEWALRRVSVAGVLDAPVAVIWQDHATGAAVVFIGGAP
jgi:hypothetical protein